MNVLFAHSASACARARHKCMCVCLFSLSIRNDELQKIVCCAVRDSGPECRYSFVQLIMINLNDYTKKLKNWIHKGKTKTVLNLNADGDTFSVERCRFAIWYVRSMCDNSVNDHDFNVNKKAGSSNWYSSVVPSKRQIFHNEANN